MFNGKLSIYVRKVETGYFVSVSDNAFEIPTRRHAAADKQAVLETIKKELEAYYE